MKKKSLIKHINMHKKGQIVQPEKGIVEINRYLLLLSLVARNSSNSEGPVD